jgi:Fic family protein
MLALADKGTAEGLEVWCIYVLQGVREELQKVDRLTDFDYLKRCILNPAINFARQREWITATEEAVLVLASKLGIVKSADLTPALPNMKSGQRTYLIKKLVSQGMLLPINEGARQYTIGFSNNYLIRGVVRALTEQGFIPAPLERP